MRNYKGLRGLKVFIFWPYGFENLGFLTNASRGAMKSKTQWVFYSKVINLGSDTFGNPMFQKGLQN
jgi:hypothetical protein